MGVRNTEVCQVSLDSWGSGQRSADGRAAGMLASDAERERAVDVLKAAFAEGRLTHPEYEDRIGLAYRSRTQGELQRLVWDLPQGPGAAHYQPAPHRPAPRTFLPMPPGTNSSAVAALICGVAGTFVGITAIPAVILGHKARREIRRTGEQGDGMALAGLVLGWLVTAAFLVGLGFVALVGLAAMSSSGG